MNTTLRSILMKDMLVQTTTEGQNTSQNIYAAVTIFHLKWK